MHHTTKSVLALLGFFSLLVVMGVLLGIQGNITGAPVVQTIACAADADCDDGLVMTEDFCRNPGTRYSLCVNQRLH